MRWPVLLFPLLPVVTVAQATQAIRPDPGFVQDAGKLYVVRKQQPQPKAEARLVDVLTTVFSLLVSHGEFVADDRDVPLCVRSRRRTPLIDRGPDGRAPCPMIIVVLNGTRLAYPAEFLASARVGDIESIQLINAIDATTLYGRSAGGDALVIWSRGQGPHAQR